VEGFTAESEHLMLSYKWPGNVRELKNVIRGIVVLQNTKWVLPEHLPAEIGRPEMPLGSRGSDKYILPAAGMSLDDFEKDLIIQALEMTGRNKTKAAKLLHVSYDSFRYQLKKFGLE
jgi:two-component system response regulator AtoC